MRQFRENWDFNLRLADAEDFGRMNANAPSYWRAAGRVPRLAGRALVKAYRYTLSPLIGFHCRYLPTCSDYADQALGQYGLWTGGWMTLARLCRCHPYGNSGLDFVCEELPRRSRWYLPWRYGRWRGTNAEPPAVSS